MNRFKTRAKKCHHGLYKSFLLKRLQFVTQTLTYDFSYHTDPISIPCGFDFVS